MTNTQEAAKAMLASANELLPPIIAGEVVGEDALDALEAARHAVPQAARRVQRDSGYGPYCSNGRVVERLNFG